MRMMIATVALFAAATTAPAQEDGFTSIFDGKTLEGWDGDPDFWRVEDGAITAQTTKEKPLQANTFIIWREGELADFELKIEYRIFGGNSGIQYRSFEVEGQKWVIGGYQADLDAANEMVRRQLRREIPEYPGQAWRRGRHRRGRRAKSRRLGRRQRGAPVQGSRRRTGTSITSSRRGTTYFRRSTAC